MKRMEELYHANNKKTVVIISISGKVDLEQEIMPGKRKIVS